MVGDVCLIIFSLACVSVVAWFGVLRDQKQDAEREPKTIEKIRRIELSRDAMRRKLYRRVNQMGEQRQKQNDDHKEIGGG